MKTLILMLFAATALHAASPASIAGKIYRESSAPVGLGGTAERTIHFLSEERYSYISIASASAITEPGAGGRVLLRQPPSDGRYVYRKTGETSAIVEYFPDNAPPTFATNLTFTGSNFGGDGAQFPRFSFWLSDPADLSMAPTINISMRGRVGEGRSLIIGFVVPGRSVQVGTFVPPAGTLQREVLIRVIGSASLRQFGVSDGWNDPDFELFAGSTVARSTEFKYSDWSKIAYRQGDFLTDPSPGVVAGLRRVFSFVGAFPLSDDSKDAVGYFRLLPGAYTIVADPKSGDSGGEVLVEVYFLP